MRRSPVAFRNALDITNVTVKIECRYDVLFSVKKTCAQKLESCIFRNIRSPPGGHNKPIYYCKPTLFRDI